MMKPCHGHESSYSQNLPCRRNAEGIRKTSVDYRDRRYMHDGRITCTFEHILEYEENNVYENCIRKRFFGMLFDLMQ